ncbi:CsbD family protein [Leuconostoc holzapfelii]|uniref:CsbD family protein n=1 Tax=Leuconostoc holzapfelii TaxID=434464 RepID=A0A846ZHU1_9LACO|nr:CsbD family protein [Leuconostoc holzapfelii]NKZ18852.1 CsbD family protein [Leuconostoc holzapfelii]
MSVEEKFDSAKDQVAGKAKEVEGKVTGDQTREAEGKAQGVLGKVKETFSDVKEAVKDTLDDYKEDSKKEIDK